MSGADQDSALRAHEDAGFLRAVLTAVPAFVVLVDRERRIVYINRMQPGFRLEQVLGRSVEDFTAPEYHERQRIAVELAFESGTPQSFLMRARGADGSTNYYESRAVPVDFGDDKRAVCIIAVDVTEHVARSEALKASEEKLRVLVEATGMGLWTWDAATQRVEWNARMHEITGSDVPLGPADYAAKLTHPDDRDQVSIRLDQIDRLNADQRQHRIIRADGSVRWVMPCGRAVRDQDGEITHMMGGMLDVTEQRMLEERLRAAQKIDAIGALTAGVAHNFNNMLAVIVPTLDLILGEIVGEHRKLVHDAAHAARRATELVAQLMTYAGQRRAGERTVQELAPVVERAISMCERTFAAQVAIELSAAPCGRVRCDAAAIEQVIVNLLINARDAVKLAGKETSRVHVELSEITITRPTEAGAASTRYARIVVRDEGIGMSAGTRERVFEPFFTTKEPGRGTGLGLPTSYGIVRDHGGFIQVTSEPSAGATFEVHLPIESTASGVQSNAPPERRTTAQGVVLIVDDEAAIRSVVEHALALDGHTTRSASDEPSLMRALQERPAPDVVLLDRSMPNLSATLALRAIRQSAPGTPVLYFTGQDVPPDERAQVEGVLYKPLSLDELVSEVNRWVQHTTR